MPQDGDGLTLKMETSTLFLVHLMVFETGGISLYRNQGSLTLLYLALMSFLQVVVALLQNGAAMGDGGTLEL